MNGAPFTNLLTCGVLFFQV